MGDHNDVTGEARACEDPNDKLQRLLRGQRQRVWSRILKLAHHDLKTGCLVWMGRSTKSRCTTNRYGRITVSKNGERIEAFVHRVAFLLHVGQLKTGMEVDHVCQTTLCCNPKHLRQLDPKTNHHRNSPDPEEVERAVGDDDGPRIR